MKKVVKSADDSVILLKDVTNSSFVGVHFSGDMQKAWITVTTRGYEAMLVGEQETTSHWTARSKKDYVAQALDMKVEVYVFDTHEELCKWLVS